MICLLVIMLLLKFHETIQVPDDMLTFNDILKLKDNYMVLEEIPRTAPDNFIYLWNYR
jgi:hypothetical protein